MHLNWLSLDLYYLICANSKTCDKDKLLSKIGIIWMVGHLRTTLRTIFYRDPLCEVAPRTIVIDQPKRFPPMPSSPRPTWKPRTSNLTPLSAIKLEFATKLFYLLCGLLNFNWVLKSIRVLLRYPSISMNLDINRPLVALTLQSPLRCISCTLHNTSQYFCEGPCRICEEGTGIWQRRRWDSVWRTQLRSASPCGDLAQHIWTQIQDALSHSNLVLGIDALSRICHGID